MMNHPQILETRGITSPVIEGETPIIEEEAHKIRRSFGAAVKSARKKQGLSQAALAIQAQFNRSYITDIENGARNISLESMCKIAKALGISVASLLSVAETGQQQSKKSERLEGF